MPRVKIGPALPDREKLEELSAGWRGVSDGMRVFSKMRTPERRRRQACSPTTAESRMDQTPEIFHLFASLFGADFIFSFTQRPKPPPPKTPAFWDIVDANRAPEDAELADILDAMKNPDAVTLFQLLGHVTLLQATHATGPLGEWLRDRKNRRAIPHRLEKCGYTPIRNGMAGDGLWVINGSRQVVYAKDGLSVSDRLKAANELAKQDTRRTN